MTDRKTFFIGGGWRAPEDAVRLDARSSVDGSILGTFPAAIPADMDAAVHAARTAFEAPDGWTSWNPECRAEAMESFAKALKAQITPMAELIAHEVGTPLPLAAAANGISAVSLLRMYAGLARSVDFESERPARAGRSLVIREPVGVVAMIVPWNIPVGLMFFKLAPALAAGCTVVIKPSPETALSSYLIAEAAVESGLPDGVLNIVPAGRDTGEYLVRHPGIDKIAFTGSTAAGRRVGEIAGHALKPATLELGGKSAAVLLDDADVELFLAQLPSVSFVNNGQACTNCSRILVPSSRLDEVTAAVTAKVESLRVGDPRDSTTDIGPMVSPEHRARVEGYIRTAIAEGAVATTGGVGDGDGAYVRATVLSNVTAQMQIAREEVFGPVLVILPYGEGDDAAVAAANDSDYGLAGTVFSADVERAAAVARRIQAGTVGINSWNLDFGAPFGGRKASGLGYELGPEALSAYLNYKTVTLP